MMTRQQRFAFLADWANRNREVGLAQADQDEAQFPGIAQDVRDWLDMGQEFARRDGDWRMACRVRRDLEAKTQ
jgi:hypothetical protein